MGTLITILRLTHIVTEILRERFTAENQKRLQKDHLPYNEQLYTQSLQKRHPAWFVFWSAPSPQESILDTPPRSIENTFSKKVE
jgi:hypothetical protein